MGALLGEPGGGGASLLGVLKVTKEGSGDGHSSLQATWSGLIYRGL